MPYGRQETRYRPVCTPSTRCFHPHPHSPLLTPHWLRTNHDAVHRDRFNLPHCPGITVTPWTTIMVKTPVSGVGVLPAKPTDLLPLTLKLEECAFDVLHLHCRLPSAIFTFTIAITTTTTTTTIIIIVVFPHKETGFCTMWESH
jgi:hypothetical protein